VTTMITQEQALKILHEFKEKSGEQYGILSLGVFGSLARGQATEESDVDVVVETVTIEPFKLVHLKEHLESLLGTKVDLVRKREKMNLFLKKRINSEALYV